MSALWKSWNKINADTMNPEYIENSLEFHLKANRHLAGLHPAYQNFPPFLFMIIHFKQTFY